jgi:hypothetical protein
MNYMGENVRKNKYYAINRIFSYFPVNGQKKVGPDVTVFFKTKSAYYQFII